MSLDPRLLEILRCPASGQALKTASDSELDSLNRAIATGSVTREDGSRLSTPLAAALITVDGSRAYRIDEGIPVMLVPESIPLAALHAATG